MFGCMILFDGNLDVFVEMGVGVVGVGGLDLVVGFCEVWEGVSMMGG